MIQTTARTERYDHVTIALHWVVAALIAVQWLGAHVIDWFPKGPLRVDARSVHIVLGVTLAAVMTVRLAWRLTRGARLPPAGAGWMDTAARLVHGALYLLVLAVPCGGLAAALTRGDSLFGLVRLGLPGGGDPAAMHALAEEITDLHGLGANLILGLAALHAGASLYHHLRLRDGVLLRMFPA